MVLTRAAAARSAARSAAARFALRSWNEMLLEILALVLKLLPCVADRQSFAATCVRWKEAALEAGAPPAQLPMAVLPPPTPGAAATVFSILSGSTRRIHVPSPRGVVMAGARLCGSHPGRWVAFAGENAIAVVKHMTDTVIPLPVKMLVVGNPTFQLGYRDMDIRAVSFSTDPSFPNCVAAAITGGQHPGIALRDAGAADYNMQHCWISSTRQVTIQDLLSFHAPMAMGGQRFHAITDREGLVAISMGMGPAVQIEFFRYDVHREVDHVLHAMPKSTRVVRYLVESRGKLLMVRRYYRCSPSDSGSRKTLLFRVFQWETTGGVEPSSWLELDGLDGRVLFLARGCSRSFDELPPNCDVPAGSIYFLDDTRLYGSETGSQQNNTDMGVYYMGEQGHHISMTPSLRSPIYGARYYVVTVMNRQGNIKIKLFERLQQLKAYAMKKPAADRRDIQPKGCMWRFIHEPESNYCLPSIWLAH